ncbi:MAG: N-acetylmuramoyl-L-alanine amidase [Mediterranea sp.]|jgi:N-acetylmuramoyl-L-alanine amidase|nr:N-acetylmuramoyl-L-alanine amidase [Mediterranea sp.]
MRQIYTLLTTLFLLALTTTAWGQRQTATPRRGEGISAFLIRHDRSPRVYYDDFVELNRRKLGKGKSLLHGVAYTIPPLKSGSEEKSESNAKARIPSTRVEPLLGKRDAEVKISSNRLAGCCFYVVSGHGGPDPGAIGRIGKHQLHEDEYAYDIALRLARNLMQEGAEVRVIIQDAKDGIRDDAYLANSKRETCMGEAIPLNQTRRLAQRCQKINALYRKDRKRYSYCRAIFIHVDSRGKGNQTDVFFYHSKKTAESKRLAGNMKKTFEANYNEHQPNRGFSGTVSGRNLYVLAQTTPVSVFVELGNIQNSFDQKRLIMKDNRQALAKWLMEGFLRDHKGG